MLRLIRGRRQERGAVAVIVALVVGMFVLTGVAALTIDAGRVYAERRVLQNGADAASLALAQICAKNIADPLCADNQDLKDYLTILAGANAADDHLSSIFSICGSGREMALKFLPNCAGGTALIDCPAVPASLANINYVEVRTRTLSNSVDDPSKVPGFFAGLKSGAPVGKTVQACSRAGWGSLGSVDGGFPLVLGACAWNSATKNGTYFAPAPDPQYDPAPNSDVKSAPIDAVPSNVPEDTLTTITAHTSSGVTGAYKCTSDDPPLATDPAGKYSPGGFGWVKTCADPGVVCDPVPADLCSANFSDTGNVDPSTGGAAPAGCKKGTLESAVGTLVYIPIFTSVLSTGPYVIDGLAAFYLAGIKNIPSVSDLDGYIKPTALGCNQDADPRDPANTTCIWGWFTAKLAPVGWISTSGSTLRGSLVVQQLG